MNKALKAIFFTGAAVLAVLFFLSITGIIDNNRGNSFGFPYRTDYTCFLLTMALIYAVITNGWLTWLGELGYIVLDAYILWLGGKTSFVLLTLLILCLFYRHYSEEGGVPFRDRGRYGLLSYLFRVIYLPVMLMEFIARSLKLGKCKSAFKKLMSLSFLLCGALSVILALSYRLLKPAWDVLPLPSTYKDRFKFSLMAFEEYPVALTGNDIGMTDGGHTETYGDFYFTLDIGYIRTLLQFGLIAFVALIVILTLIQLFNLRKGYFIPLLTLTVFAVDFTVEFPLTNILLYLVFLAGVLVHADMPDKRACDRLNFAKMPASRRWCLAGFAVLALSVFFIWSVTAYKITDWRGYIPAYNASVVIPGDYPDSGEELLDEAAAYLVSHEDSVCIVSRDNDRESLKDLGIDEERIYFIESAGIDEMLLNASRIIKDNDLPDRLTVCAYSVEQSRIADHAHALGIPVNSIPVKPDDGYFSLFAAEQWRILCGD